MVLPPAVLVLVVDRWTHERPPPGWWACTGGADRVGFLRVMRIILSMPALRRARERGEGGLVLVPGAAVVDDLAKSICKIVFERSTAPLGKLGGVIYEITGPRGAVGARQAHAVRRIASSDPGDPSGATVPVQAVAGPRNVPARDERPAR